MTIAAIITSVVAILLKLTPILLQLVSILIPTPEQKHEGVVDKAKEEQDKLDKEGRPTWK